jgi:hypothetical protein
MGSLELRIFPAFQRGNTVCASLHAKVPQISLLPVRAIGYSKRFLFSDLSEAFAGCAVAHRRASCGVLRLPRDSTPSSRIKIDSNSGFRVGRWEF